MSTTVQGFTGREIQKLKGVTVFQLNSAADSFITLRQELAPKDTGWMAARTRQIEVAEDDHLRAVVICDSSNNPARGGNNDAYDEAVEYGTINSPAQPSATPAFESAKRQLKSLRGVF